MRPRAWGAIAGLAILAAAAARLRGPDRGAVRDAGRPAAIRPAPTEAPVAGPAIPSRRNPFEFARPSVEPGPVALAPTPWPPPAAPPSAPADPLRLVGFVRSGGQLRAVVAVSGQVVVASPGDAVGESTLVAVDEDLGVTVRGPDGESRRLSPERRP